MKKSYDKRLVPIWALICFLIGIASTAVYFAGRRNPYISEWVVSNIGSPIRQFLAKLTALFRPSIAEIIILICPVILVLIFVFAAKRKSFRSRMRYLISLLAVASILWSGYIYVLGIGYSRTYVSDRMGISNVDITEENLYTTLLILQNECEALLDEIEYDESGLSIANIDFDKMCDEVCLGYERLSEEYPECGIEIFNSVAKEVMFSKAMTYLEILGIYTFFTGESNVNVHYPDYTVPSTIAHEFAHQRGIARENEANFISFMVCIRADDPYVRYSGYINMFEYVASALGRTNKPLLRSVYDNMDERMYGEMRASSDFYYDNKIDILGDISNFFNDNYLKSQGTEGVVSYGMVVRLCVSYYCNE